MPAPCDEKSLIGKVFGRFTVIKFSHRNKGPFWLCRCICGVEKTVLHNHLISGATKSCGCYRKETSRHSHKMSYPYTIKHHHSKTRLYRIWVAMKQRCHNMKCVSYRFYGALGIAVCQEWFDSFESFRDWALANGYADNLTIERSDNSKGYSPENCTWIPLSEQSKNKRQTKSKHVPDYVKKTLDTLAKEFSISRRTLCYRLNKLGLPLEEALHKPIRGKAPVSEGQPLNSQNYPS